jgi:hypothetical protein
MHLARLMTFFRSKNYHYYLFCCFYLPYFSLFKMFRKVENTDYGLESSPTYFAVFAELRVFTDIARDTGGFVMTAWSPVFG